MEKSFKKFQKYASHVEGDIEALLFSMLDLIDSKTETIRKLVKLHMHIKAMSTLPKLKQKLAKKPLESIDSKSVSMITNNTNGSANEINTVDTTANKDGTEFNLSEPEDEYQQVQELEEEFQLVPANTKEASDNLIEKKADAIESSVRDMIAEEEIITIPEDVVAFGDNNSNSTLDSFIVIANLEGALNTLQQYQPGESGILVDNGTYMYVIDLLQSVIKSYNKEGKKRNCNKCKNRNNTNNVMMDKCITLPALKVQEESFPKRLTSSTTDCNKYCRSKKCCKKCNL